MYSFDADYWPEEVAKIGAQAISGVNSGYAVRKVIIDGEVVFFTQFPLKHSVGEMKHALSAAKSKQ